MPKVFLWHTFYYLYINAFDFYNVVKLDSQIWYYQRPINILFCSQLLSKSSFKSLCYTIEPSTVSLLPAKHTSFPAYSISRHINVLPAFTALLFGGKKGRCLTHRRLHNGLVCFDSNNWTVIVLITCEQRHSFNTPMHCRCEKQPGHFKI